MYFCRWRSSIDRLMTHSPSILVTDYCHPSIGAVVLLLVATAMITATIAGLSTISTMPSSSEIEARCNTRGVTCGNCVGLRIPYTTEVELGRQTKWS